MNKTIVPIPYKKIYLPFNENVASTTVKRIEKLKPYYSIYDVVVPVEKDKNKDFYHLVGAIPFFCLYTKKMMMFHALLNQQQHI